MNKETIEIPLVKATYEELQQVICELQVERYIKDKEIERLNKAINEIKEKIDDYFGYDYENESQARLDTLNEINHIIVELKEGKYESN